MSADWAMVFVTIIYVVATIFISWANIKSADASKKQLLEMQRQYEEMNRPSIEVEFQYIRRKWYVVRFVNNGRNAAQRVKINLDPDFVNSLPEENIIFELNKLKGKECIIGAGQHYDLFIGSNALSVNPNMHPVTGTVEYKSEDKVYTTDIYIDLEHYMTFYSTKTDEEDILKYAKQISVELNNIKGVLENQYKLETEKTSK